MVTRKNKPVITLFVPRKYARDTSLFVRFILYGDLETLKELGDEFYQSAIQARKAAQGLAMIKVKAE
jgi:hypothetical protein